MRFRHLERGGPHFRVADPDWETPLDGSYAAKRGARWNGPNSFPVVYLFGTVELARSFVIAKHQGLAYSVLDFLPERRPVLAQTEVPKDRFVDVVTDRGCMAATLPPTYPLDEDRRKIGWGRCRPIGQAAWDQGEPGIVCRSSTARDGDPGEELAWFQRERCLPLSVVFTFEAWFEIRNRD